MVLWILATLSAFFVKGLCGFANTLVFTSILGFGSSNVDISPVEIVLGFPTNVILAWKERKNLQPRVFVPLALLILAGSIPGALFLKSADSQVLKVVFGAVLIFTGLEMLAREYKMVKMKESKLMLGLVGLAAGVLSGLFGVGALLAAYVSRVTDNTSEFKANFSAVFIMENLFRMGLYGTLGIITGDSLKRSLVLFPFMLLGLFGGMKSSQVLDEKLVKKLVILLLVISGGVMIWKNMM